MITLLRRLFTPTQKRWGAKKWGAKKWGAKDWGAKNRGAGYSWLRLRYQQAEPATKWLQLLSQPETGDPILLYYRYRPKGISRLMVGLPAKIAPLAKQMANHFGFSVQATGRLVEMPALSNLTPVAQLPWQNSFVGEVQDGQVAIWSEEGGELVVGTSSAWCLPASPQIGLQSKPDWSQFVPVISSPIQTDGWQIGMTQTGDPLCGGEQIQLHGEATVAWLVSQITHQLHQQPAGLVVLDGSITTTEAKTDCQSTSARATSFCGDESAIGATWF